MDHHFREQDTHAKISRRAALQALLSGAAATALPVVAEATPTPTDDEIINACIVQLEATLQRMHPIVDRMRHYISEETDGTFCVTIQGYRKFEAFTGDGLYEVSMSGYVMTFWLQQKAYRRLSDGTPISGMDYYEATQWYDGEYVADVRRLPSVNIVRKLEGVAP